MPTSLLAYEVLFNLAMRKNKRMTSRQRQGNPGPFYVNKYLVRKSTSRNNSFLYEGQKEIVIEMVRRSMCRVKSLGGSHGLNTTTTGLV